MKVTKTQFGVAFGALSMTVLLAVVGGILSTVIEPNRALWFGSTLAVGWVGMKIIKKRIDFDRLEGWAATQTWIETEDDPRDV